MKVPKILTLATLSLALALPTGAQSTKPTNEPDPGGGAGGGYSGPGDTTPTNPQPGNEDPNSNPTTGAGPGAGGPATGGGSPYAAGANPFGRPRTPGSSDYPGSGTATPPPINPASRPLTETPNSWKLWWHYNRWAYLDAVPELAVSGLSLIHI